MSSLKASCWGLVVFVVWLHFHEVGDLQKKVWSPSLCSTKSRTGHSQEWLEADRVSSKTE